MIMDKKKEPAASSTPTPAAATPVPPARTRSYLSRETFLGLVVAGSFIALVGGVVAMKTFLMPAQAPQANDVAQAPPAQPPEPPAHVYPPIPIPAHQQPTSIDAGPPKTLGDGEASISPSTQLPSNSVIGAPSVPDVHLRAPDPVFTLNTDKTKSTADIRTISAETPAAVAPTPGDVVAPSIDPPVAPLPDAPKNDPVVVTAPPDDLAPVKLPDTSSTPVKLPDTGPAPVKLPDTSSFQSAVKEPEVKRPDQRAASDNSNKRASHDSAAPKMDDPGKMPPPPDAPPLVPPIEPPVSAAQTKQKPAPDAPTVQPDPALRIDFDKMGDAPKKSDELTDAQKKKDSPIKIDLGPAPTVNPPANPPADPQKKADPPALVAPVVDSPPLSASNVKLTLPKKVDAPIEPKVSNQTAPASLDIAPKTADKKDNDFDEDLHSLKQNESYRSISKQYYNSDAYSIALQRYNRDHPGQSDYIRIPPIWFLEKNYASDITAGAARPVNYTTPPAAATPRTDPVYTVSDNGELLADIARKQLGSEDSWKRIWDLNPQLNPAKTIPGGTRLHMPGQ
jgi:hypothetical protein